MYESQTAYTLCVACDMPFLNSDLLGYMLDLRTEVDCVVPTTGSGYESLHAIYRHTCLRVIREQLESGNFRIQDIYQHLHIRPIADAEVTCFDPEHRSFVNLNTPDDILHIEGWLS